MKKKTPSKAKKASSKPKSSSKAKKAARPAAKVKSKAAAKPSGKSSAKPVIKIADRAQARELLRAISTSTLPPDYRPTDKEEFMNPRQLEYFRRKLHAWRLELLKESEVTLESLQEGAVQEPDLADRASAEMERALELRTRDRARKLITKIDSALQRIEDGSYGFCEETGEPISLKRLEARPIATLSIEAQERHERMERTHRSD
jgi:DnaK suppressor protein